MRVSANSPGPPAPGEFQPCLRPPSSLPTVSSSSVLFKQVFREGSQPNVLVPSSTVPVFVPLGLWGGA